MEYIKKFNFYFILLYYIKYMDFSRLFTSKKIPFEARIGIYVLTTCGVLCIIAFISNTVSINSEISELEKEEEGTTTYNNIEKNMLSYSSLRTLNSIAITINIFALTIVLVNVFKISK